MTGQGNQAGSQPSDQPVDMSTQVQVTVDGQQMTMSIQDLANGYAAGSKMTQATQRAAQLQTELDQYTKFWNQLQQDPQAVIGELQTKFGITPEAPKAGDNPLDDDPLSAEVTELKQLIAQQNQTMQAMQGQLATQAQTQAMKSEISELERTFGDAFKADEVATYAQTHKIANLTTAFHAMQGERSLENAPKPKIMSPVLPGSPISQSAISPPEKPAGSLAEAITRGFAAAGQEVEVSDLIPG